MWREMTALWSMGTLLVAPLAQAPVHANMPAPAIVVVPISEIQRAVTPDMKDQFNECLLQVARQIKVEFADQIVAHHPISGSPIRVSDSRVTIEKIAAKLKQKTTSVVEQGGNFEIDQSWNAKQNQWLISGFLILQKDAVTGLMNRQYAKNLLELKNLLCS